MTSHDFRPNHERHPWKLFVALFILILLIAAFSACRSQEDLLQVTPDTTRPNLYPP